MTASTAPAGEAMTLADILKAAESVIQSLIGQNWRICHTETHMAARTTRIHVIDADGKREGIYAHVPIEIMHPIAMAADLISGYDAEGDDEDDIAAEAPRYDA